MAHPMSELSSDPKVRKGQFRTMAREAMETNRWQTGDPVARVVSLLERTYAAGRLAADVPDSPLDEDAPVPWEAIPQRSRDILRWVANYRKYWDQIHEGALFVIIDGARKVVPRDPHNRRMFGMGGTRATMGLWRTDGEQLRLVDRIAYDWPASSASSLVKLGVLEEAGTEEEPYAFLTVKGIATFDEAVRTGSIGW